VKCLRCGYCCKNSCVVIVDDPTKGIQEDNLVVHMGGNTPCKHLLGDKPGEYMCAIHNEPWYKETPCYRHGQIEPSKDTPCRMGVYQLGKIND
jgi:hypothetical protein